MPVVIPLTSIRKGRVLNKLIGRFIAPALLVFSAGVSAEDHPTITIPGETFSIKGELMNLEVSDKGA